MTGKLSERLLTYAKKVDGSAYDYGNGLMLLEAAAALDAAEKALAGIEYFTHEGLPEWAYDDDGNLEKCDCEDLCGQLECDRSGCILDKFANAIAALALLRRVQP